MVAAGPTVIPVRTGSTKNPSQPSPRPIISNVIDAATILQTYIKVFPPSTALAGETPTPSVGREGDINKSEAGAHRYRSDALSLNILLSVTGWNW
jgi:hypothetical protein